MNILRLLGHLVFVGGTIIAAFDLYQHSLRQSGSWAGILFLGITAILGFPWTLLLFYALSAVSPLIGPTMSGSPVGNTIYLILHSSGMFINYGIFLWITKKMKERIAVPKVNAS